jgi:prevent-host-death family protein
MDRTLNVSDARATLPEILDQVETGDEVTITRHGRPVAVLVRPDALQSRRAGAALATAREIEERLAKARRSGRPAGGLSPRYADKLIAEIRAGRSKR